MIEIAISLAVIGFALVAIIGVLPFGMDVQKQNREETIINQDASVFMNAIRNGVRGLDDLTNYVFAITNTYTQYRNGNPVAAESGYRWYDAYNSSDGYAYRLAAGSNIVGLLSTPKFWPVVSDSDFRSNSVVAYVRALSGPASEKFPQTNTAMQDLGFSYRMFSEVDTYGNSYIFPVWTNPMPAHLKANLHELRLLFRWPLAKGTNAQGRQLFRTMVGGRFTNDLPNSPYYFFFQPQTYVQAKP